MTQKPTYEELEQRVNELEKKTVDLKGIEKELYEKQEFIQKIINTIPGFLYIYDLIESKNVFVNKGVPKVLGYTEKELQQMGSSALQILFHPDDTPEFENMIMRLRKAKDSEVLEAEYRIKHKRGQWIAVHDRATVFKRTPDGQASQILGYSVDITESNQTEEQTLVANERLQYLLSSTKAVIYTAKTSGDYATTFITDNVGQMTGYDARGFVENPNFWFDHVHPEDKQWVSVATSRVFEQGFNSYEYRFRCKDGTYMWVWDEMKLVRDEAGNSVEIVGYWANITERKQAEEQIKASLKEKEVLLREIHHRVKNNMQVISSLLMLQSTKIKDKHYADMFNESQQRIKAMALVHDKLYESKDFANIDFSGYIKDLINSLFSFHGIDINRIGIRIQINDVSLDIEKAIPCGLIINELVTNSLKYAFPDNRIGEIRIGFRATGDREIELLVSDDGVGMPDDFDIRDTDTLGFKIVSVLAEQQLQGQINVATSKGTEFQIRFKEEFDKSKG